MHIGFTESRTRSLEGSCCDWVLAFLSLDLKWMLFSLVLAKDLENKFQSSRWTGSTSKALLYSNTTSLRTVSCLCTLQRRYYWPCFTLGKRQEQKDEVTNGWISLFSPWVGEAFVSLMAVDAYPVLCFCPWGMVMMSGLCSVDSTPPLLPALLPFPSLPT